MAIDLMEFSANATESELETMPVCRVSSCFVDLKSSKTIFLNEALAQNSTNPQKIVDLLVLIHKATNCQASKGQSFYTELFADPLVELGRKAIERDPLMGPPFQGRIVLVESQQNPAGNRIKHELVPQFGR